MISSIPAVLDALVAAWTVALPDVQVVEGQPVTTQPDVICIGFTGTPGESAVAVQTSGRMADMESYDILCLFSSWNGSTDAKRVRDRAFEMIEAANTDLARDRRLGGAAMRAWMTVAEVAPEQTTKGAVCTVRVTVHVEAQAVL